MRPSVTVPQTAGVNRFNEFVRKVEKLRCRLNPESKGDGRHKTKNLLQPFYHKCDQIASTFLVIFYGAVLRSAFPCADNSCELESPIDSNEARITS